jgi:hypothetical protein
MTGPAHFHDRQGFGLLKGQSWTRFATISTRQTPQSKPADPRQVPNSAGGFTCSSWTTALAYAAS